MAATRQPKSPKSNTSATSLIIGAAMRKENVTPNGTPVVTKPINNGTAEQEQNGVTTPSKDASTFPSDSCVPARIARVCCGVKNDRTIPTPKTTSTSNMRTFGVSKTMN